MRKTNSGSAERAEIDNCIECILRKLILVHKTIAILMSDNSALRTGEDD